MPYLLKDLGAGGDPVIAFDQRRQRLHWPTSPSASMSSTSAPSRSAAQVSSIAVAQSEDDGFTWPTQISAARSRVDTDGLETDRFGRLRGIVDLSFLDKPWMAVGAAPRRPRAGRHLRHLHQLRPQLRDPLHRRDPQPAAHRDAHHHRAGQVRGRRPHLERPGGGQPDRAPRLRRARRRQRRYRRLRHAARGPGQPARGHRRRHRARGLDGQHRRPLPGGRRRDPGGHLDRCRRDVVDPGRGLGLQRDRVPPAQRLLPLLGLVLPADRRRARTARSTSPTWAGPRTSPTTTATCS